MRTIRMFGCVYTQTPLKSSWWGGSQPESAFREDPESDLNHVNAQIRNLIVKIRKWDKQKSYRGDLKARVLRYDLQSMWKYRTYLQQKI